MLTSNSLVCTVTEFEKIWSNTDWKVTLDLILNPQGGSFWNGKSAWFYEEFEVFESW